MRVYFDPSKTYRTTPMIEHNGIPGYFCHIMVSNEGKTTAQKCRGRLLEILIQDAVGNFAKHPSFVNPVVLKWANEMDYEPKDIEIDIPRRLDLCYATDAQPNVLIFFTPNLPNGNLTAYPPGVYKVKIRVDGQNTNAVDNYFIVDYQGTWNQIQVNEVTNTK